MIYPNITLHGTTYDIYDIAKAFGVTDPALFNAFKKIIRRGNGAKSELQDLREAIQAIQRRLRDFPEVAPPETHTGPTICDGLTSASMP